METSKQETAGNSKRSREEAQGDENHEHSSWKVVRLAAKDREQRKKDGGDRKSKQQKVACEKLQILEHGVTGTAKGIFGRRYTILDYNHYRMQGHSGRFEAGTGDRAVFIATVAAYEMLQKSLDAKETGSKSCRIQKGDLGENILIYGPAATSDRKGGLFVGAKLKLGSALLEITEANNPCYRFNTQSWAAQAKQAWGKTAPEANVEKWFKSPDCPLNHEIHPGVRGWLAKVLKEGETKLEDQVELVVEEEAGPNEDEKKNDGDEKGDDPVAKRQKV